MKLSMLILAAGAVFLGACGAAEEPATTYLDDYASHVSALKESLKTHAAAVTGATDMTKVGPMEQSHLSDMTGHLGSMGQDVGMMGQCKDMQGGMMSTGMMGMLDAEAQAECARHEEAMAHAADMNAAMMEEDAHQQAMAAMMSQMMQMHDQMMGGGMMGGGMMSGGMMGAGDYMCPMMTAP
jgi:hypothetical protein